MHPSLRRLITASLAAAALAGCAATGGDAPGTAGPGAYAARGNEPGWSLVMSPDRLTLVTGHGQRTIVAPTAPKHLLAGGVSYRMETRTETHALRVQVKREICRDTMTGVPYPDIVAVIVDRERPLAGCGGEPASLLHGAWAVESVDGEAVAAPARATLEFRPDGRLGGQAFCNRYTAGYAVTGEGLRVDGNAAVTRMACPGPAMRLEKNFLDILQSAAGHDIRPDGALEIRGAGGRAIVARRQKN